MQLLTAISSRDRRTLMVGVVSISAIILASQGVPAWRAWDESAQLDAAEATGALTRLERELHLLPALRDSARARASRAALAELQVIVAETAGRAGAELAERVTAMADDLGLRVTVVQIRPDSVFHASRAWVAIHLAASGDVTHLAEFLTAMESSPASFAVRELTVSPSDPLLTDGRPEILRFQVFVEALAVQGPSATSSR